MRAAQLAAAICLSAAVASCNKPTAAVCQQAPEAKAYALDASARVDTPRIAYERAARCLHAEAYRFGQVDGEIDAIAEGVIGACLDQTNNAMAKAQIVTGALGAITPPPGFDLELPPCPDNSNACEPWQRDWPKREAAKASALSERPDEEARRAAAEVRATLKTIAVYRLVQARAGNCR